MSEPLHPEVAILNAALELPAAQRAAYLDQACAGDEALRRQVETLLKAEDHAQGFLEALPPVLAFTQTDLKEFPLTEKPGDKIGRYKLLQKIGEGGCGVVYMAEQEEPVRRRVALKVIKLGMDTKEFVARFDAERQALALMDHPNIAKVFDAGATDTGRPYFVMELVRGIKITEFCDENKLSTEERLKLVILVCQAIQHAHQKGVIHRDIKPSNVLVTVNDGVPVPKVIDFGIAKATAGRLTDQTLFTAFEQFIGTPAYMSPEQAVMTSLDIDTRSDIYSLGVLLYQLLTGKTPFDGQELLKAGFDEMRRVIREVEPVKPSTRLTQERLAMGSSASSAKSAIRNPQSAIDKDLDWIVMKCLEKDRARRYETANGLAADLRRHLNNEEVAARPPSALYRFQKSVRRNKRAFAAGAAVAAVLVLGAIASAWQAIRATKAEREQSRLREAAQQAQGNEARLRQEAEADRKQALAQAQKSSQIAHFLEETLRGVQPTVALGRDTTMLREILDKTAERLGTDLTNQPAVEAELRDILADVYHDLSLYKPMEAMVREALRLHLQVHGEKHTAVAMDRARLGDALRHLGDFKQAEPLLRDALATQRKLNGTENPGFARVLHDLASLVSDRGRLAEAEALFQESLEIRRRILGAEHHSTLTAMNSLGLTYQDMGRSGEAELLLTNSWSISHRTLGAEHPLTLTFADSLAWFYLDQGRRTEAEPLLTSALEGRQRLLGAEHENTLRSLKRAAGFYADAHRYATAEQHYTNVLAVQLRLFGAEHPDTLDTLHHLATLYQDQDRYSEAEPMFMRVLEVRRRQHGDEHESTLAAMSNLALLQVDQGRYQEAETLYQRALETARRVLGDEHSKTVGIMGGLGELYRKQGRYAEAEPLQKQTAEVRRRLLGEEAPATLQAMNNLALIYNRQGRAAEAAPILTHVLDARRRSRGVEHPSTLISMNNLALSYDSLGRDSEAEKLWKEALVIQRRLLGERNTETCATMLNLGRLYRAQGRYVEAEPYLAGALESWRSLLGLVHPTTVNALESLAQLRRSQKRENEARQLFHDHLLAVRQQFTNDPPALAAGLSDVASALYRHDWLAEAELFYRAVLDVGAQASPETLRISLGRLSTLLQERREWAEAEAFSRRALAVTIEQYGAEHSEVALALRNLSSTLERRKQLPEANKLARQALEMGRKLEGDAAESTDTLRRNLANILWNSRDQDGAERLYREGVVMARASTTNDTTRLESALRGLAGLLMDNLKFADAVAAERERVQLARARLPAEHEDVMDATARLALLLTEWGWKDRRAGGLLDLDSGAQPAPAPTGDSAALPPPPAERAREAVRLLRECLAIRARTLRPNSVRLGETKGRLGSALVVLAASDPVLSREGRLAELREAEPLLITAHAATQEHKNIVPDYTRNAFIRLGRLHETWEALEPGTGHAARAAEWNARRAAFGRESSEPNSAAKENQP